MWIQLAQHTGFFYSIYLFYCRRLRRLESPFEIPSPAHFRCTHSQGFKSMRFLSTSCLPVRSAASRHARGSAMWPSKGSFAHRPRLKISFKNSVASDVVEVVEELRSTTGMNDKNAMAGVKAVGKIVSLEGGPQMDTVLSVFFSPL